MNISSVVWNSARASQDSINIADKVLDIVASDLSTCATTELRSPFAPKFRQSDRRHLCQQIMRIARLLRGLRGL
jgi:hypothetical protein